MATGLVPVATLRGVAKEAPPSPRKRSRVLADSHTIIKSGNVSELKFPASRAVGPASVVKFVAGPNVPSPFPGKIDTVLSILLFVAAEVGAGTE